MSDKRRFPLLPVERIIGHGDTHALISDRDLAQPATARSIGIALGVQRQTAQMWRSRGLSWRQADEVAVKLGYHPAEIWPDWLDGEMAA